MSNGASTPGTTLREQIERELQQHIACIPTCDGPQGIRSAEIIGFHRGLQWVLHVLAERPAETRCDCGAKLVTTFQNHMPPRIQDSPEYQQLLAELATVKAERDKLQSANGLLFRSLKQYEKTCAELEQERDELEQKLKKAGQR